MFNSESAPFHYIQLSIIIITIWRHYLYCQRRFIEPVMHWKVLSFSKSERERELKMPIGNRLGESVLLRSQQHSMAV